MFQKYMEAGKLVTTHGVRGELKLEVHCGDAALLRGVKTLYSTRQGGGPLTVKSLRGSNLQALVCFTGAEDMDSARKLVGRTLYFDRADVKLPEGVYYIEDLIGCEVRDADTGAVYGKIKSIDHPGPQDIYTVAGKNGEEYLFPGVSAFLKARMPEEGYILVTPIPGMFDDNVILDLPEENQEEN